jgi:Rieske Fe-S protein
VWLIRDDADPAKVRCLQTICPHLGCGIEFSADREAFTCPCHASEFDKTGRQRFGPSPRDLDALACHIEEAHPGGQQWVVVDYREFRTGTAEKIPT